MYIYSINTFSCMFHVYLAHSDRNESKNWVYNWWESIHQLSYVLNEKYFTLAFFLSLFFCIYTHIYTKWRSENVI